MQKKLFLLDGMALVYRAHFALIARPIFTSKGVNTSALYGFTQTLLDILNIGIMAGGVVGTGISGLTAALTALLVGTLISGVRGPYAYLPASVKRFPPPQEMLERGMIVAAGGEIKPQLQALSDAGVQRVMLQWLDLDDLDGLRDLAKVVL